MSEIYCIVMANYLFNPSWLYQCTHDDKTYKKTCMCHFDQFRRSRKFTFSAVLLLRIKVQTNILSNSYETFIQWRKTREYAGAKIRDSGECCNLPKSSEGDRMLMFSSWFKLYYKCIQNFTYFWSDVGLRGIYLTLVSNF